MRLSKSFAAVAAVAASVTLLATSGASAATAAHTGNIKSSCSGTKLWSESIYAGSKVIGHTELWYDNINGGQDCAMTFNALGYTAPTGVYLYVGTQEASDQGNYSTYAGASYINSANGRCTRAHGVITYNGTGYSVDSGTGWCH